MTVLEESVLHGPFDPHLVRSGRFKGKLAYMGWQIDGSVAEFLRLYREGKYLSVDVVDWMFPSHHFAPCSENLPSYGRDAVAHLCPDSRMLSYRTISELARRAQDSPEYTDHFRAGVSSRGMPVWPVDHVWLDWWSIRRQLEEWQRLPE